MSDDPRLGDLIKEIDLNTYPVEQLQDSVVLLGFPWDEGVRRNGGRIGAAEAPSIVRALVNRMGTILNPEHNIDLR
jgi:formiminoglutamase